MRTFTRADSGKNRDRFGGIDCKTTRIMKKAEIVVFKCVKNNKNEGKQESSCFAMKALIRFGVKSGITITKG